MSSCGICGINSRAVVNIDSIYLNEYNLREIFHELAETDLPTEEYLTILICENDANKMVDFHCFRKKLLEVKSRLETAIKTDNFEDENESLPNIKIEEDSDEIFVDSIAFEEADQISDKFDEVVSFNNEGNNSSRMQSKTNNEWQNIYTCCFCPRRYFTPYYVKRHLRSSHKKTNEEIVESSTYTVSTMDKSMRRFECPLCHRRFNFLKKLKWHLVSTHQLRKKFGNYDCGALQASIDYNDDLEKSDDFDCPRCRRKFTIRKDFRKHLYSHPHMDKIQIDLIAGPSKNTQEYECEKCHSSFWKKATFIRHFHDNHLLTADDLNSTAFSNNPELQTDLKSGDKFRCTLCPGSFAIVEDLEKHLYEKHCEGTVPSVADCSDKCKMYTCECGRVFEDSRKYFNHFQYNHMKLGEKAQKKCLFCMTLIKFYRPKHYYGFLSHLAKCHAEEIKENGSLNGMVECPDCDQLHVTLVDLYRHYKSLHFTNDRDNDEGYNLECEPCKIKLNTTYEYFGHQKTVHGISSKSSVKLIKCNWCNMRIDRPGRLLLHIRSSHHQHKIQNLKRGHENCMINKAREDESRLCPICGKVVASAGSLSVHMEAHIEEKSFKCHICQNSYKSERALKRHQTGVHSERTYNCEICSKSFKNYGARKRHMITHNIGAVNHTCKICGKIFFTNGNLKAHMWTHQDGHPYNCHVCEKGFARKNKMSQHLELEHGDLATDK